MIQGRIVKMQPIIGVTFRLPGHPDLELEFVMDTGFAGALTLPPNAVAALGLPYREERIMNLADDSPLEVRTHTAEIVWNAGKYLAPVQAMGVRPLLGMLLLKGYHLDADFEEGKPFTLTKL